MLAELHNKHINRGIALIEAMIALALFSMISTSVWVLVFQADNFSVQSGTRFFTINLTNDVLENLFFTSLRSGWSPWSEPNKFGNEMRNVTPCLTEVDDSLLIVDTSEIAKRGSDCGGYPDFIKNSGADATGGSSGGISANLFPNDQDFGAVQATGMDVSGGHFFVPFIGEEGSLPDLLVGSSENFSVYSTVDFGLDSGLGFNALDVANGIIFGATKNVTGQLAIIDWKNFQESPQLIATSTLPGVAGVRPEGWSIFYYDDRLYIGTRRTAGHEFHIFDVSNPARPIWLGSREVNHNINNIAVRDGLAFLATSGNARDLIVLNVANPQSISQVLELDLPGSEDGRSLALLGKTLYLGRFKSTFGNPEFYIIDVEKVFSGGAPDILGSYQVAGDVNAISIQHDMAILGTSKIEILNIASTTNISKISTVATSQKITGVDYEDNKLFVSMFGGENFARIMLDETK